jgi:hypothetical protein
MKFTMSIDMDNAAFDEDQEPGYAERPELARILRVQADRLEAGEYYTGHSQTIRDVNGNDVGRGKVHPS